MLNQPLVAIAVEAIEDNSNAVALSDVARAGLTHLELPLELVDTPEKRQRLSAEFRRPDAGRAAASQVGRRQIISIRAIVRGDEPATRSTDPLVRAGESIDIAGELGASVVIVAAGQADDGEQRRGRMDRIGRLGDQAASAGIILALATAPGLCGETRSMARTLCDVAHPAVRLEFDTGAYVALNPQSSVEVALQRIIGHVASVRLRDHQGFDGAAGYQPLGLGGGVDFARMLQILRTVAFGGPAIVELPTPSRRDRKRPRSEQLVDSLAHLRQCGWFDESG